MTEVLWLYDLAENKVAAIDNPDGFEVEEQLQASEVLRFRVRGDDPRADYLGEDRLVQWATQVRFFRTTQLTLVRDEQQTYWEVAAEARWIDLMGYPARTMTPGQTISAGLARILYQTPWNAGSVESDGGSFTLQPASGDTVLTALRAWAKMTDREVEFDTNHQTVDLVVQQGTDRGLGFRYGRNLVSVKRIAEPVIATRLYPVGKDGLTPAAVNPTGQDYLDNFGWYTDQGVPLAVAQARYVKAQTWQDDRYINATNLMDTGTRRLATLARPRITYQASAVDLSALPGMSDAEVYLIGDSCMVWDGPEALRIRVRIVRKIDRPLEPWNTQIELGFAWQPTPSTTAGTTTGTSAAEAFSMLVDLNINPITVGGSLVTLNQVSVVVTEMTNLIFGSNLDGTATGTGTLRVTYWYGAGRVGPTSQVDFAAGSFHLSVPDYLVGVAANNTFYCKAQVVSGTGTVTFAADSCHLYIAGAGLAEGTVGASDQQIAETWIYPAATSDTVATAFLTPVVAVPAETWTYPADPTETVIHVP